MEATDGVSNHAGPADAAAESSDAGDNSPKSRPAVVQEVLQEDIVGVFCVKGTNTPFPVVGTVIAAVSREPFENTEPSQEVRLTASKYRT